MRCASLFLATMVPACTAIAGVGGFTDVDCPDGASTCVPSQGDTGIDLTDSGNEPTDTGTVVSDSGNDDGDTGIDLGDSGDALPDSGVDVPDVGLDASDAVIDDGDAGQDASDTGIVAADSGTDAFDAGFVCPAATTPLVAVTSGAITYRVEATEVTVGEYAAFLAAKKGDVSGQPAACGWNATYTPAGWTPPATTDDCSLPVTNVDWCDATAYCASIGRRLCGEIGGGAFPPADFNNVNKSEWYRACSNGASTKFTYGASYAAGKCVDSTFTAVQPVGSLATCHGAAAPYDALHDLNGNVFEWVGACSGPTGDGSGDNCQAMGGSYLDKDACDFNFRAARNAAMKNVGVRCCAD